MSDLAVESPVRGPSSRERWQLWLSPADQPAWARPLLLGFAAASAVLYAWGSARELEVYYAAAVRSMSMSWYNFFYAAFDPDATVSIDSSPLVASLRHWLDRHPTVPRPAVSPFHRWW
jgi:hypothetical protein